MLKQRLSPGIRGDKYGFEAYVKVGGVQRSRRFPLNTDEGVMQTWRTTMRLQLKHNHLFLSDSERREKAERGWCYVYIALAGQHVKIGRAIDVDERIRNMQSGQMEQIKLLATVPAHPSLEPKLHELFRREHERGEWFRWSPRIERFVEAMRQNLNPLIFLFEPHRLDIA